MQPLLFLRLSYLYDLPLLRLGLLSSSKKKNWILFLETSWPASQPTFRAYLLTSSASLLCRLMVPFRKPGDDKLYLNNLRHCKNRSTFDIQTGSKISAFNQLGATQGLDSLKFKNAFGLLFQKSCDLLLLPCHVESLQVQGG